MANKPNTEFPYQAQVSFIKKYLRPGKHTAILPMDDALTSRIGRVTAYWCYYESMLNQLIDQMLGGVERKEPNWQRRPFAKRCDLAKELLKEVAFPKADQEGKRRIRANLGAAADLQWRRNAIVHGTYTMKIGPYSSAAIFSAHGTHNGKSVPIVLHPDTLDKLFHDIAHLTGEFIEIGKLLGDVAGLAHSFPDTQLLELCVATDQKNPPTQQTP